MNPDENYLCPFLQSETWSKINALANRETPVNFSSHNITCLFGLNEARTKLKSFCGPILKKNVTKQNLKGFLRDLHKYAEQNKIYQIDFLSMNPLDLNVSEFEKILSSCNFKKTHWETFIIDLSLSEEDLLRSFKASVRKNINKYHSRNIAIKKCEDFETFYQQYMTGYLLATNRKQISPSLPKRLWELDTEGAYDYWVCYDHNDEAIGYLGTYNNTEIATEIMSAMTPLAKENKIPVSDLLHWEIMKFHQKSGVKYYDLAGINPNPKTTKEKNILRFKKKWNGIKKECSSFSYTDRTNLIYWLDKIKNKVAHTREQISTLKKISFFEN